MKEKHSFFMPERYMIGDTWQISDGNKVHTFFLQWKDFDDLSDRHSGSIGHAVSSDLLHWEQLPDALLPGEKGSYDDLDLWTGSSVFKDGKNYLFYTSRNAKNPDHNAISLAISEDMLVWEKHEKNPVLKPDPRYYHNENNISPLALHGNAGYSIVDCRDMCVVYDEERGCYWGFTALRRPDSECSRTSVIGLSRSYDLINWEQLPPCFCPNKYHCIETPDVFFLDGKWYMLCLSGNYYGQRNRTGDPNLEGTITVYAVSDKVEGPYTEISDNVLLGSKQINGICAKTVLYRGKRYLFSTQICGHGSENEIRTLSFPKEVVTENGRLYLKWFDGIDSLFSENEPLNSVNAIENTGKWGTLGVWDFDDGCISASAEDDWTLRAFDIISDDFIFECELLNCGASSAGVAFGIEGNDVFSDNRLILLDFEENEVVYSKVRRFTKENARRVRFPDEFALKILRIGSETEVYIDNKLVLHHQDGKKCGKLGLFAECGTVKFKNAVLRRRVD